ncbi:MAG: hypothetical protein LBC87_11830 [Fibromonadaceae bacterium]|nr:hypothetical protein [Fibromonadaceae bacterium]
MRIQFSKTAFVVSFGLALAFTFGCSSDSPSGPSGGEPSPKPSSASAPPQPSSSSSVVVGTQYYDVILGNWNASCPNLNDYPELLNNVISITDDSRSFMQTCLINPEYYTQSTGSQVANFLATNGLSGYANEFDLRIATSSYNAAYLIYINTNNYYRVLIISYSSTNLQSSSSGQSSNASTFIDTRDGETYRIETFNSYTWMIEDLRFGSGIYNKNEASTACPNGWHLPDNLEVIALQYILQYNYINIFDFISTDYWWGSEGVWYVDNGKTHTVKCGKDYSSTSPCSSAGMGNSASCARTDPCLISYQGSINIPDKKYRIRCVKDQSVAQSSSSAVVHSSSSKPSSSSSAPPSSSSLAQSSSSTVVPSSSSSSIVPSSSSVMVSSSSVVVSSSSSVVVGLCDGFVDGTPREHYGKSKAQFCDSRDGKKYVYVTISTRTWMAENLNYRGTEPDTLGRCYNNDPTHCDEYGRLYNWEAATKSCPKGWHLPGNAEWDMLYRYVDGTSGTTSPYGSSTAGTYLKATGQDTYGFSALQAGCYGAQANGADAYGGWWTASALDGSYAYYRGVRTSDQAAYYGAYGVKNTYLLSVRCVRD